MDRLLIDISGGLAITSAPPTDGIVGQAMPYYVCSSSGGVGLVKWSIVGDLPAGIQQGMQTYFVGNFELTLDGTPTAAYIVDGSGADHRSRYTIRAVDEIGQVAEQAVVQTVMWPWIPAIILDGFSTSGTDFTTNHVITPTLAVAAAVTSITWTINTPLAAADYDFTPGTTGCTLTVHNALDDAISAKVLASTVTATLHQAGGPTLVYPHALAGDHIYITA